MALRLKGENTETLFGNDVFKIEGNTYRLYLDDPSERQKLQEMIGLPNYKWFHEQTGNCNWVLYNPKQYKETVNKECRKILCFNNAEYDGTRLEVPINASSCCGLFSWSSLPDDLTLSSAFDTRDIIDTSLMFAGTVMPKGFSFGKNFKTKNVKDMHYMFYQTTFRQNITLEFDTQNVENMECMFCRSKFLKEAALNLNTFSVKNMRYIFQEAQFSVKPSLGDHFHLNERTMNSEGAFLAVSVDGEVKGRYDFIERWDFD